MSLLKTYATTLFERWQDPTIDYHKYDFYADTRHIPAELLSRETGIEVAVIEDRRRYLQQLSVRF